MVKWDLSQGCKDFSVSTSQLVWYKYVNKLKNKNHIIFSIDAEKLLIKFNTDLWLKKKTLQKVGIEGTSGHSLSCVQLFVTPWTAAHQASLSITNYCSLLKLMSLESVMPSNHLILCCPLLLSPSIFPSIRVFSNESVFTTGGQSVGVSASASVLPKNSQDWFPLGLMVWSPCSPRDSQESSVTPQFKSISSLALSFPTLISYMTTGKTIALTRWTFVGKVMSCFLICCLVWS